MDKLVTVTTVRFDYEAQLIKSRLQAAEIPCFLAGEYVASLIGRADWGHPLGGICVRVSPADFAEAQEILRPLVSETTEAVRLVRPPWHRTITGGLRKVPLAFRVPLIVFGGLYAFAMALFLLAAVVSQIAPEFPNFLKP